MFLAQALPFTNLFFALFSLQTCYSSFSKSCDKADGYIVFEFDAIFVVDID